jgi:tRNA A-37 threonylcarbamoyl transferase component Bud32
MDSPQQFGKYTLLKRIATGGMAEIMLARMESIGGFEKEVVVKRLLPEHAENEQLVEMFLDEARIAANLTHPNITQIFDLGQEGDAYYIAMEYVHGVDLRRICSQGIAEDDFLPLHHAVRIVAEVCDALAYAQTRTDKDGQPLGIVHRDVSPTNILVTYDGGVKLVDFGIAKAANKIAVTKSGQVMGKFGYMAPEQARGEAVDARSDIFAAGINLYEITAGRRLFKAAADVDVLELVSKAEVPDPRSVKDGYPDRLAEIAMKALAADPDERFQTAREMQMALEDFLAEAGMRSTAGMLAEYMRSLFREQLELEASHAALAATVQRDDEPEEVDDDDDDDATEATEAPADAETAPRDAEDAANAPSDSGAPAEEGAAEASGDDSDAPTPGEDTATAAEPAAEGAASEPPTAGDGDDAAAAEKVGASRDQESPADANEPDATDTVAADDGAQADDGPDEAAPHPADDSDPKADGAAAPEIDGGRAGAIRLADLGADAVVKGRESLVVRMPPSDPAPEAPPAGDAAGGAPPAANSSPASDWANPLAAVPALPQGATPAPTTPTPSLAPAPVQLSDEDLEIKKPRSYAGLLLLLVGAVGVYGLVQVMERDAGRPIQVDKQVAFIQPKLGAATKVPENAPPPDPEPTLTLLKISSKPEGARVVVNGNVVAGVTPTSVQTYSGLRTTVQLLLPGYLPATRRIPVADTGSTLEVALEKGKPDIGSLRVETAPPGALLLVNGAELGTTPMKIERIAAEREISIRLEKQGYYPHVATFTVGKDEERAISLRLVPDTGPRTMSVVNVDSVPIGANIFELAPGKSPKKLGRTGKYPLKLNRKLDRPIRVRAEKDGFEPTEADLDVRGPYYTVTIRLPEIEKGNGTLALNGPRGLTVYVGPNEIGKLPVKGHALTEGDHDIVVFDEKSRARTQFTVKIRTDQTTEKTIALEEGKLSVQ